MRHKNVRCVAVVTIISLTTTDDVVAAQCTSAQRNELDRLYAQFKSDEAICNRALGGSTTYETDKQACGPCRKHHDSMWRLYASDQRHPQCLRGKSTQNLHVAMLRYDRLQKKVCGY